MPPLSGQLSKQLAIVVKSVSQHAILVTCIENTSIISTGVTALSRCVDVYVCIRHETQRADLQQTAGLSDTRR